MPPLTNTAPQATERTLRAMLAFRLDPRGLNELNAGTSAIEKHLEALDNALTNTEADADKVVEAFTSLASSLQSVGTREAKEAGKRLEALVVQFQRGKIGVNDLTQELDKMEDVIERSVVFTALQEELQQLQADAALAKEEISDLSNTVQALESVGQEIAGYAQMIVSPLRSFAQQYVTGIGKADEASQKWLQTTKDLETAQQRLGGVAVEAILPLMELTAEVVDKAAAFAEEYPELVQAVFGIGTAIILASSLQAAVSKGIRLIADAKLILIETKRFIAAQMNREAADKMLVAATINQKAATQQAGGAAAGGIRGALAGLGGLGGLASALSVTAAIAAWAAVGLKVKSVADDAQKKTQEMGDRWEKFFKDTSKGTESAVAVADKYNEAQKRVQQAYNDGGIVASIMFDREKMVNASRETINRTLIHSARSYEDYEQAVTKLNNELGRDEEMIGKVTEATFNHRREMKELSDQYKANTISHRQYAEALIETGHIMEQIAGMVHLALAELEEMTVAEKLVDDWTAFQDALTAANTKYQTESDAAWDAYWAEREKLEEETTAALEKIDQEHAMNVLKMELDFETAREQILADTGQQLVRQEETIGQQRENAMMSFMEEMLQAEEDYYEQRADSVADYNLETQRSEQDHQIAMRRMREDHAVRATQAIRARDAIALREENRSYETDRQRAEEDYMLQAARRSQDFARQLAQMEEAFREQQEARQKAHDRQMAELAKQEAEELKALRDAGDERLTELDEQRQRDIRSLHDSHEEQTDATEDHNEEQKADLIKAYRERRNDAKRAQYDELRDAYDTWTKKRQAQGVYLQGELGEVQAHYQARLSALRNWMRSANAIVQSGTPQPGRAAGGYVTAGTYRVGEAGYEYVMNNQTTRMAENLAGGNLTQAGLRGIMGGRSIQLTQEINIQDGRDPERIGEVVRRETLTIVHDLLKQVN